ncbi:MAG TPA: hypothetical protein VMX55_02495 [candidate division Zixibacteria bacterium]|nr:hypothetical protein [candidate division Zixibacteria bacterium]
MSKIKYIKACPFLRDLGDSFLCINDDTVVDVLLDPLIDVEWSEYLKPVASDIPDQESCLFTLEVKDDGKLYCISREKFLRMDKRLIQWKDIRDSIFLLNLNESQIVQNSEVDFCSTCLYKVLLASSPAFQQRLDLKEKIRLGISYILNRANEIIYSLSKISQTISWEESHGNIQIPVETNISKVDTAPFSWLLWLSNNPNFNDDFIANSINWFQKFDEWSVQISKIADEESDEMKIRIVEQSIEYASFLKQLSYDMVIQMVFLKNDEDSFFKKTEKIFTVASINFEDYIFICNQFLDIVKE